MKKIYILLCLLFMAVMFSGCGETDNSTVSQNTLPPQEYNKTFTLQGKIMDAVTGAPIGNDSTGTITMFLIQGDQDRGPTKLHTDPNDPLVGEYSISGIPADIAGDPVLYKVVVYRQGYQNFEANVQFTATNTELTIAIDGTLNMIGNIYLFPIGSLPGTVHVHVLSPDLIPVPGATVLLQQDVANNDVTAIRGNRLVPSAGLYTSMTTTTDANGVATFNNPAFPLVLGGSYKAVVNPLEFQGDELARTTSGSFIIGTNSLHQTVNMGSAGFSFFATSASNQVPGTITPSGVLTVSFNEPITLTTTGFTALLSSTTGTVTSPVQGVLSNNNQTLTITPEFTATPTGAGAFVTYSSVAGQIILQNSQTVAQCGGAPCILFDNGGNGVRNVTAGNTNVSGRVQLIAN